jgi:PKD repeat protein
VAHPVSNIVTAVFNIPIASPTGAVTAIVAFEAPAPTFSKTAAFTVTPGPGVQAGFTGSPLFGLPPLTVIFTNTSAGTIAGQLWNFGDGTTSTNANPAHAYTNAASYTVSLSVFGASATNTLTRSSYVTVTTNTGAFAVEDTGQTRCYNETTNMSLPRPDNRSTARMRSAPASSRLSRSVGTGRRCMTGTPA